ncbi:MAG: hypothetical protein AAF960_22180 [Bacteroidota bacterium]
MQTQLSGTYEDIKANFEALIDKFDKKILEVSQVSRNQPDIRPQTATAQRLNKLKLERAKVKHVLLDIGIMTKGQVLDLKGQYDEDYKKALRVLAAS